MRTQTFHMADVGEKPIAHRVAVAQGRIVMSEEAFIMVKAGTLPKGNPIPMAETAGILAAKRTADILPLCHPLALEKIELNFEWEEPSHSVLVECTVSAHEKTGVEMEALFGVQAALLTIYDLTKPVDPALTLTDIRLKTKAGGKKGFWTHPAGGRGQDFEFAHTRNNFLYSDVRVSVLTLSDRASKNEYPDHSGEEIKRVFKTWGAQLVDAAVIPDEPAQIRDKILHYVDTLGVDLVVTTGGTGLSKRDCTPEVVSTLCDRLVPGIAELLRQTGAAHTPYAWLSRSVAGIRKKALIVTLPGSLKAVKESLSVLEKLLLHALDQLKS